MHVALLGTSDDKIVSGKTLEETYILMLASLRGVTEAAAKGIAREYPTIRDLYEAWEACGSERDRKEMLAGVAVGCSSSNDEESNEELTSFSCAE